MDRHAATLLASRMACLGAIVLAACRNADPGPLNSLGTVTRVDVTYSIPGDIPSPQTIVDSERVAVLRAAARRAGDWHSVLDTPPAGVARAAFYRDSVFLGVLSVGTDFIGASAGKETRFRNINAPEAESIYVAIGLPPKPKL